MTPFETFGCRIAFVQQRKIFIVWLLAIGLLVSGGVQAGAAPKKGVNCSPVGKQIVSSGYLYKCVKNGKAGKWSAGTKCPYIGKVLRIADKYYRCAYLRGIEYWSVFTPKPVPTQTSTPTPTPTPTRTNTPSPVLEIGNFYSGEKADGSSTIWIAIRVTNGSNIVAINPGLRHVNFINGGRVVQYVSDAPPSLKAGSRGWWVTSCIAFCSDGLERILVDSPLWPDEKSGITENSFPRISAAEVAENPSNDRYKVIRANITNTDSTRYLGISTDINVVMLDGQGSPVYAFWSYLPEAIPPQTETLVDIKPYLDPGFKYPAGVENRVSSVSITIGPSLCSSASIFARCTR